MDQFNRVSRPCAMTIAGSDSGGGAGIQTDLRTFTAFGVFGTSAVTALTAQNPAEVRGVFPVTPDFVRMQIQTVRDTLDVRSAKTGMLFSAELAEAAADAMRGFTGKIVTDPVMVSTSGHRLLQPDAVEAVKTYIFPLASWITPNLPEAEMLTGMELSSAQSIRDAVRKMSETWNVSVILKGGHSDSDREARDFIRLTTGEEFVLRSPRLNLQPHAGHGTGCTFSAALCACFALGRTDTEALTEAKTLIQTLLADACSIGKPGKAVYGMFPVMTRTGNPAEIRLEAL